MITALVLSCAAYAVVGSIFLRTGLHVIRMRNVKSVAAVLAMSTLWPVALLAFFLLST